MPARETDRETDDNSRETEFNRIADEWDTGTAIFSFWWMSAAHPKHAELLEFGKEAVPYLLRRMAGGNLSHDNTMLMAELSGETPNYEPEVEGGFVKWDVESAARSWLEWGVEKGYL